MKLSKIIIEKLSEFLDENIVLKGIYETLDGAAIKMVLNLLNNKFGEKIPDTLTPMIEGIIDAVVIKDWDLAGERLAELLAAIINTPFIDGTPEEISTFKMIISMIIEQVENWIESQKQQV